MDFEYVDQNRQGDHICYISNLDKMKAHYPDWGITKNLRVTSRRSTDLGSRGRRRGHDRSDARPYISVATPVWNAAATVGGLSRPHNAKKLPSTTWFMTGEAPIIRGILFRIHRSLPRPAHAG